MRTVHLLRHATTEGMRPGHPDRARRLTAHGEQEAVGVGLHLRDVDAVPDLIVCSPATRVQQTVAALRLTAPVEVNDRLYDAGSHDVLEILRELDVAVECALIVGHAPGLPATVHELADPSISDAAALAAIDWRFPAATLATLTVSSTWADLDRAALMAVRLA